jgi:hypothetical protein
MFCWYYQWKISKLADENDAVLSHEVAEHLKRCSACRRFHHLCRGMERRNESLPIAPQTMVKMQQEIMRQLYFKSAVRKSDTRSYRKTGAIAAVLILLIFPAAVMWTISADPGQMLKKETVDVGGLAQLSEVVWPRWMDERAAVAPEYYVTQSYQKQLREMTRNGKQAAAFMFSCLNPGLQISETPSDREAVFSQ